MRQCDERCDRRTGRDGPITCSSFTLEHEYYLMFYSSRIITIIKMRGFDRSDISGVEKFKNTRRILVGNLLQITVWKAMKRKKLQYKNVWGRISVTQATVNDLRARLRWILTLSLQYRRISQLSNYWLPSFWSHVIHRTLTQTSGLYLFSTIVFAVVIKIVLSTRNKTSITTFSLR